MSFITGSQCTMLCEKIIYGMMRCCFAPACVKPCEKWCECYGDCIARKLRALEYRIQGLLGKKLLLRHAMLH